ncbi:uncharacterized protein ACRADG_011461 [Cochliomyia hominivorax]
MCQSMSMLFKAITVLLLLNILPPGHCEEQDTATVKPGRYVPELYGAHLGKYIPDDSGKYFHIHRPYDGGYGDRGIKYVHDASGNLVPLSTRSLGPKDHLRFMLDFNYDNTGWQIINFEWLRDGDENYKFKFVNENQLFMNNESNGEAADESSDSEQNNGESDVHIDGEYTKSKGYNYSYDRENSSTKTSKNLQQAIREVIYYIENNILPTL